MELKVWVLGAGQDVGKSCVVVTIAGRSVMFDCGLHMGFNDHRRFPEFSLLAADGDYTRAIDAVVITHFHLDHVGGLPYFTEVLGYRGPVYMTPPTKAVAPLMLDDYHRVLTERAGQEEVYTRAQVAACLARVTTLSLNQTLQVGGGLEVCCYYAGHVLGAAMFSARVGSESVVYTGDYNTAPERHLGAASVPRLQPDLLISEATYAATLRDSRSAREHDFLAAVAGAVERGGKVLVPVFAVGRAQELLMLLAQHWDAHSLWDRAPVYMSAGLAAKANVHYRLMASWGGDAVRQAAVGGGDPFGLQRLLPWDRALIARPGPCVLFATPGMLHGGTSLEVFRAWAGGSGNLVVLPGYCAAGTVGNRLLSGATRGLRLPDGQLLDVHCQVKYMSFSAHADARGIVETVRAVAPRAVMLVHGEAAKMAFLAGHLRSTLRLPVATPANGTLTTLPTAASLRVAVSRRVLDAAREVRMPEEEAGEHQGGSDQGEGAAGRARVVAGIVLEVDQACSRGGSGLGGQGPADGPAGGLPPLGARRMPRLLTAAEAAAALGVERHTLLSACGCGWPAEDLQLLPPD